MANTSWALQTLIYSELSAALSVSVFDYVPSETAYPYVVIGQEDASELDSLSGERRHERFVTLSVYSAYTGQKEVKEILHGIYDALHRKRLSLSSGRLVEIVVEDRSAVPDADGESYMGRVTIRAITEP